KEQDWKEVERKSHTVFVDGLPQDIAKLSLYKIFGWAVTVVDIYVSRKKRRNSNKPFAFIRFDSRGGVERAVQKINGTFVGTSKMTVKFANFQRGVQEQEEIKERRSVGRDGKEIGQQPVLSNKRGGLNVNEGRSQGDVAKKVLRERKAIKVQTDPTQADLLKRSVVAESINTIRFGWRKEQIAEKWEGPGEVECRDLGPFKCLLTFKSVEARDIALRSPGLQWIFFEIRPQWGFTRTLSRRVWLEVVGVPVHLWSEKTFMNIGKIWGKPVMMDEITDYYLSYTCASILIDSYEWEMIHEWVVLEDGDKKFEVYVKEFGREMYSA
ncbi:hypothetical protein PIB30_086149, partial [Stylosanthes scabra]|nr:hypothetical protein [Stylosanthes scabra]